MGDINQYFSKSEFACKDRCGNDNISMDLIERLNRLRTTYAKPIYINSACRCKKHNQEVGGVPDSAHVSEGKEGEAIDIRIASSQELYDLLHINFMYLLFNRVGIGKTLLHLDVSKTLPQNVVWIYSNK